MSSLRDKSDSRHCRHSGNYIYSRDYRYSRNSRRSRIYQYSRHYRYSGDHRNSGEYRHSPDYRYSRDSRSREHRNREKRQPLSSPIIKRVKTADSNNDSPNSAPSNTSIATNSKQTDKFDAFKATMNAIKTEELNAINSSAAEDGKQFRWTCQQIRDICKEILELKKDDQKNKIEKINSLRIEGSLRFLALKTLNRCDKYRCRAAKEKLQTTKQKVDSFHIRLQNVLYEVLYLQRKCKTCVEWQLTELKHLEQRVIKLKRKLPTSWQKNRLSLKV